jgi:RNA polymerase sigma-70 factor (ECF subfamily)
MSMSYTTGRLYTITGRRQASDTSDVALIRSIAAGDKHAMQILFVRHNVRVFRFLLRFVADRSAAEDLVSEVFLDVWQQAGRFEGRSQVTTWLLAIARYEALSALQRRSTEEPDEDVAAAIEDPQDNPEITIQNRQTSEILLDCSKDLSPAHREVPAGMAGRRILGRYAAYYNESRIHRSLDKDAPFHRAIERFGVITSQPVLGGLHHQYCRI